ncbi:MAG: hypothetical protein KAU22_02495, partial [Desulfuromonadales bacterium]|nr:hypothetical protein [Desulfuromonadales bacterium]
MTDTIETQMLDALELFHYAYKFRNHQFVLVLEDGIALEQIMLDIRMLYSAHIKVIILYKADQEIGDYLNSWSQRGFRLHHSASKTSEQALALLAEKRDCVEGAVIGLDLADCHEPDCLTRQALLIAEKIAANKVFFLGALKGLSLGEQFLSHPLPSELEQYLDQSKALNMSPARLRLMIETTKNIGIEIIILAGK